MSYRINRGMGWGMPFAQFEQLCQLQADENDKTESLWQRLGKLTADELTVPEELYRELLYASRKEGNHPVIFERNLLATNFTNGNQEVAINGRSDELFTIVMDPDNIHHVMFFPNLYYARKWCRHDDPMDYEFEHWRDGGERGGQGDPRDFACYVGYGFYPYTNNLMLADGTPVAWDHYSIVERHPEWLPAVPSEIRWYLTKFGVLDDAGVNQLRPLIAQWWC